MSAIDERCNRRSFSVSKIRLSILIKKIILYLYCKNKKWSALHTTPSYKRVKRVAAVEQKKEDSKWEI